MKLSTFNFQLLALLGLTAFHAFGQVGGGVFSGPGGGGGGGSVTNLPSTTNILAGNGSGGASDTGVSAATLVTNNTPSALTFANQSNAFSGTLRGTVDGLAVGLADTNSLYVNQAGTVILFTNSFGANGYYYTNTSVANSGKLIRRVGNYWNLDAQAGGINTGTNFSGSLVGPYQSTASSTRGFAQYGTNTSVSGTSLSVSNATYGGVAFNRTPTWPEIGIDSFGGNVRFTPAGGATAGSQLGLYLFLNSGGSSFYDYYGNSSYYGLYGGSLTQPIPFATQWLPELPEAYNFFSGFGGSEFAHQYLGSGAGLADLPAPTAALNKAMPTPPIIVTTWGDAGYTDWTESILTNHLNNVRTNGLLFAVTNAGQDVFIHLDQNAMSWMKPTRTAGLLTVQVGNFPSGTNMFKTWHDVGFKIEANIWTTNGNRETQMIFSYAGTPMNPVPMMEQNTVRKDVKFFLDNFIDGIRVCDVDTKVGYYTGFSRKIANAVLSLIFDSTGAAETPRVWSDPLAFNYSRPLAISFLTDALGFVPPEVFGNVNLVQYDFGHSFKDQIANPPNTIISTMNFFRSMVKYELPQIPKGHWCNGNGMSGTDGTGNERFAVFATTAMENGAMQFFSLTNQLFSQTYPLSLALATNANWLDIRADTTATVFSLYDNGATNVSAWAKPLKNGDVAVLLANEMTSGTSNLTVNLAQYPFSPVANYLVTDIFNQTNLGTYTGSLTVNVTNTGVTFLRLSPVRLTENFVMLATNVVSTNLTAPPLCVTITNAGYYRIDAFANCSGFGGSDQPTLQFVATNTASSGMVWSSWVTSALQTQSAVQGNSESVVTVGASPFPITAAGDTYNRLAYATATGTVNIFAELHLLVQVTNPPAKIFLKGVNTTPTTTNTIYSGAFATWRLIK